MKVFKQKELNDIAAISDKVRKDIDEFKPIVPLALALTTKGMKDRHWEEIKNLTGVEVNPDQDDFTLQNCVDKGMLT